MAMGGVIRNDAKIEQGSNFIVDNESQFFDT